MKTRSVSALTIALACSMGSTYSLAQDGAQPDLVAAVDQKIEIKHQEIQDLDAKYDEQKSALRQLQNDKVRLASAGEELEAKRNRAKSALDKQYSRLLEDPDTDLVSFQKQYQESWAAVKDNQTEQLKLTQSIEESESRLSQLKHKLARMNSEYTNLQESRFDARVKRLETELRESAVLETRYTTNCSPSMTLGECSSQGQYLTKQKAVNTFKGKLINDLTESELVRQNLQGVQLNIYVQESQVIESGFSGNGDYATHIQAQLQARPEATAACKLLGLSTRYCLNGQATTKTSSKKQPPKSWVNLTVRSDQYGDAVTINGVSYGSTPVELMLPKGKHQVTVSKQGYETYNREIYLNNRDTVWVKLAENSKG
ncbi:PEGA domain-containing protein [Vibrio rotiferianus]|uniref:PEGA domain-containing protein n=1 Tax=Vibrio rotiferianus TaxID=190895 RepID=UPI0028947E69|nr:Chromosome partitioning protein ParA [Vibrio rotiferianus]